MLRAFLASDPGTEGLFYVAVKTTGVLCRQTCSARTPNPHQVEFFSTASEAFHGGYRPCKRCRPMDVVRHPPALVERLSEAVERNPTGRVNDKDLAALDIDHAVRRHGLWRKQWLLDHERRSRLPSS